MIVALAFLTIAVLIPQNASAAKLGIKGGLNLANYNYDVSAFDFTNLKGPIVGGFFSLSLGPVAIQPEIYYSRRGVRYEYQDSTNWFEERLDYIEVPVLIKVAVIPGPIAPIMFAGGYGSYLISAKAVDMIDGTKSTEDKKEFYKKTDYGLIFGTGIEFKLAVIRLIVEGRYTLGLANILSDSAVQSFKNKGISVLVGVGF